MSFIDWLRSHLVPRLAEDDPNPLVLLAEADGEATAGLWAGILEQRGIHCMMKNVSSLAHLRMAWNVRVYVLRSDEAYARELLGLGEQTATPDC